SSLAVWPAIDVHKPRQDHCNFLLHKALLAPIGHTSQRATWQPQRLDRDHTSARGRFFAGFDQLRTGDPRLRESVYGCGDTRISFQAPSARSWVARPAPTHVM